MAWLLQQQQTQSRKLQGLKDRLTMRKEDIEHINNLIGVETVELGARKEQLQVLVERTSRALKDMDDEAAAREAAKVPRHAPVRRACGARAH